MRSRRSSRCRRMKTTTISTMPAVASGWTIGDSTSRASCQGRRRGLADLHGGRPRVGGGACGSTERRAGGVLCRRLDLAVEAPHDVRKASDRALAQGGDLVPDGGLVARNVAGELRHLQPDHPAERQEHAERHQHGDDHCRHPAETQPAQEAHEGSEDEAEQDRQHDGDEDLAPEIQRGDRRPRRRRASSGRRRSASRRGRWRSAAARGVRARQPWIRPGPGWRARKGRKRTSDGGE